MKNKGKTLIFAAFLSCLVLVSTNFAQKCGDFKNKTYIAFGETIFDQPANVRILEGAYAFKVRFNADGTSGAARAMTAYKTKDPSGLQEKIKFECISDGDGTGQFHLTISGSGTDKGYYFFKSYDNGSRVRLKSNIKGRDTPFWMVEQPAEPTDEQFPK